jgi:hypothetical protein
MSLEHKKDKLQSVKQFHLLPNMLNQLNKGNGKDNKEPYDLEKLLNNEYREFENEESEELI